MCPSTGLALASPKLSSPLFKSSSSASTGNAKSTLVPAAQQTACACDLPLNGRPGLRVAVWLQGRSHVCAGLSFQPISCTHALSVTQKVAATAVCGAIQVKGLYRKINEHIRDITTMCYTNLLLTKLLIFIAYNRR